MRISTTHRAPAARALALGVATLAIGVIGAGLSGCREERTGKRPRQFFPDLDNQRKYQAQQESHFFKEYELGGAHGGGHGDDHGDDGHAAEMYGRTQRLPVAGTVPFGRKSFEGSFEGVDFSKRGELLQDDHRVYEGIEYVRDASGRVQLDEAGLPRTEYLATIPVRELLGVGPDDPTFGSEMNEFIELGRENFNIYCIVCHGGTGDGSGPVGSRWSYPLPSWHTEQYLPGGEKGADGYLFHTILYGVPNVAENAAYPYMMRGYKGKVTRREAWAIVSYIRALQETRRGTIDQVPSTQRQELMQRRGASEPQASAAPGGAEENQS